MNHRADPEFWFHYRKLPHEVKALADKNFALLKQDERHRSLRLKPVRDGVWSARVGIHYRALALQEPDAMVWVLDRPSFRV